MKNAFQYAARKLALYAEDANVMTISFKEGNQVTMQYGEQPLQQRPINVKDVQKEFLDFIEERGFAYRVVFRDENALAFVTTQYYCDEQKKNRSEVLKELYKEFFEAGKRISCVASAILARGSNCLNGKFEAERKKVQEDVALLKAQQMFCKPAKNGASL